MLYRVKLTEQAIIQIEDTRTYISTVLSSPDTANKYLTKIHAKLSSLDDMPERYTLVDEEPWKTYGVRKMPVDNHLVYYWVDYDKNAVWIIAIIYERRDQLKALTESLKM